jgi:A/G-specific adenine glycosylase
MDHRVATGQEAPPANLALGRGDVRRLLRWARDWGRHYPWRDSQDPYVAVATELMLVRTRADQVRAIWPSFFRRYPTLESLATADDGDVSELLRPLGLRWRGRRILEFARAAAVMEHWEDHMDLLPGGGPYVAGALNIARSGRGELPVDVTIARVVSRYAGLTTRGEARRDQRVIAFAKATGLRSRRFFHAWLDLAALICTPSLPACPTCPLRDGCQLVTQSVSGA